MVRHGEVFGLLGQNGAGKTTTILMLLGCRSRRRAGPGTRPRPGPQSRSAVKRQVGYLPDNVGFYGGMTGRQNLRYTARLNGLIDRQWPRTASRTCSAGRPPAVPAI